MVGRKTTSCTVNASRRKLLSAAVALAGLPRFVRAQSYPSKPIRLITTVAAGSGSDRYARVYADGVGKLLGQQIVVDNRAGVSGNIVGAELVARARPDGYTLMWGQNALFGTIPHVHRDLPFDVLKDFTPIAGNSKSYMFLCVPAGSPAATLKDLIALAKRKPGALNYGSVGIGSGPHVAMALLQHETGLDMQHVPYKGGSPEVLRALLAGEIDAAFDYYVPMMAQVRAGKLRALGISSLQRLDAIADIATIAEQGVPRFETFGWSGFFGPREMPKKIVDPLVAAIVRVRTGEQLQGMFRESGAVELAGSQEQFAAFVRAEYERGARLVRISGATIE